MPIHRRFIIVALVAGALLGAEWWPAHAGNAAGPKTVAVTTTPICAYPPKDRHVPGRVLVGNALYGLAADNTTGHVFVLSNGSHNSYNRYTCAMAVFTLDGWSGKVLVKTRLNPAGGARSGAETFRSLAVSGPAHRLFSISSGDLTEPNTLGRLGSVSVLDTRTGRLMQTINLLPHPQLIAIDVATYRAFVLYDSNQAFSRDLSVAVIAVTRGVVIRTVPVAQQVKTIAVDQRAGHIFLLSSSTVTTLDGATGSIVNTATLPSGYYVYNGYGVDERTGRLFVALEGVVPSHGTSLKPPNLLVMIDTHTGSVIRTITQSSTVLLGQVVVDEPAGIVVSSNTDKNETRATVLDAATGSVLQQVRLALPPGGFTGPTIVDPRTGDIFGYTSRGVRAIHPRTWNKSRGVTTTAYPIGEDLTINARTHRLFGLETESPVGPYSSVVRAVCTAQTCR